MVISENCCNFMVLIYNEKGELLSFMITPGDVDDRKPLEYKTFMLLCKLLKTSDLQRVLKVFQKSIIFLPKKYNLFAKKV